MSAGKKRILTISVLLVILSFGIYTGFRVWSGSSSGVSAFFEPQNELSISELIESLDISQVMEGQKAPDFNLPSIDNNIVQLSQHRGKVVLLSFWATW